LYVDKQLRAPIVPEPEYDAFCDRLRPLARVLDEVLALEEEMLTNPLTVYYEALTNELRTRVCRTIPDFASR
jgi:hypothetical protein